MRSVSLISSAVVSAVLLIAACGSTVTETMTAPGSAVPVPVTETLSGQMTGAAAARAQAGEAPVVFPVVTWAGVVATASQDVPLGSVSPGSIRVFATPRGNVTVRYVTVRAFPGAVVPVAGLTPGPQGRCLFSQVVSGGTYVITSGTGGFSGASGRGSYGITDITQSVNPVPSQPCSAASRGTSVPSAAQVVLAASGPLTVTPGS